MTTAAYDAQADAFTKRVQWLVEIDLDRCQEDFGSSPCTASGADGSRCYYSFQTCQDETNYNPATHTWRFCLNDVPWPDLDNPAYPYLTKFVAVPQQIDPAKLYVYPEKIQVTMNCDWNPMPPDQDKTAYNTRTTGEFWRNLLARNRNYSGRAMRILRGFYTSSFTLSDFDQIGPDYKLKEINIKENTCIITAESPLADLNKAVVPWAISEDNTLQNSETSGSTSFEVRDGSEYPDPANYSRNTIYVRVIDSTNGNEDCEVSSISSNTLTVVRARNGTTAVAHAAGCKVEHLAIFGTDNGASAATGKNVMEVCQDLLEWAGVASADVDDTTFDHISDAEITANDTLRILTKSDKVSKHLQAIREIRGILIYIDTAGKWAAKVVAPDDTAELYDSDRILEDTVEVKEDEDSRITRVKVFYDPNTENPQDRPDHYDKSVFVIFSDLEGANNYADDKVYLAYDPWIDPSTSTASVRNIARRMITRRRSGIRTVTFQLDIKEASLNVGDLIYLQTRKILGITGAEDARPLMIIAKEEKGRARVQYTGMDINYSGRYLRIGATTIAAGYDSATAEDKLFGYWGDSDNRVGSLKEPGYIFW